MDSIKTLFYFLMIMHLLMIHTCFSFNNLKPKIKSPAFSGNLYMADVGEFTQNIIPLGIFAGYYIVVNNQVISFVNAEKESTKSLLAAEKESRKSQLDAIEKLIDAEKESRKSLLDAEKESRKSQLDAIEKQVQLAERRMDMSEEKFNDWKKHFEEKIDEKFEKIDKKFDEMATLLKLNGERNNISEK